MSDIEREAFEKALYKAGVEDLDNGSYEWDSDTIDVLRSIFASGIEAARQAPASGEVEPLGYLMTHPRKPPMAVTASSSHPEAREADAILGWSYTPLYAQSPASGEVEPVYQLKSKFGGGWDDVTEDEYAHAHESYIRRTLFTHPPAKVPEGWNLVEHPTCYQLHRGNEIVAVLAGPNTEANAEKLKALLTTPTPATTPETEWVKCEPDLLWDAESPEESCRDSAFEFADDRASDMPADETMVVNVLCAKMLPSRKMKIWVDENDDLQWEWITPPQEQ